MADLVPTNNPINTVDTHFVVKDQTIFDNLAALGRTLLVLFGFGTAILAFFKTRDLAGFIQFAKDNQLLSTLSGAIATAALVYGQIKTFLNKKKLITASAAAPNNVATVVTKA